MKFDEISAIVGDVPFISRTNGRFLYDLILREDIRDILELGIAHGTATCYMAAALQELGHGMITCVDLMEVKDHFKPSAEDQLAKTGLLDHANIIRTQTGYTWFLHDEIRRNTQDDVCTEVYDLCIIDGPKNWTIDGAAFFFVDKLLRNNAWLIFDDYNWTYAQASRQREVTDGITHRTLSQDEQEIPHIREVFELLVKQHPHYGRLMLIEDSEWAIAQKQASANKSYTVMYSETARSMLFKALRKAYRAVRSHREWLSSTTSSRGVAR
ncbi:MAG: class I SAM-dependent methyltransferase [Deltaproteobacteria bacterium]|nr:MAG: class I SAM-dependent methyltransferase [Deltaproteobacteria bacterium]TMQ13624.1 MAG: class I SAM-dependent methyltransferase [Deltaproteobacteria bacterium]